MLHVLPAARLFLSSAVYGDRNEPGGGNVRAGGPARRSVQNKVAVGLEDKDVVCDAENSAARPETGSRAAVHAEISGKSQKSIAVDAFAVSARGPDVCRRVKHKIAVWLHGQHVAPLNQRLTSGKSLAGVKGVPRGASRAHEANHENRQEGKALRCHLHQGERSSLVSSGEERVQRSSIYKT